MAEKLSAGFVDLFPHTAPAGAAIPQQQWIQIGVTGTWKGHPDGVETVTRECLQSALDYFNSRFAANGVDLVVDWDHQSLAAMYTGKPAPAAGWIKAMELRANGEQLWANVSWNPEAVERLNARSYRYASPVFSFDYADPVTGKTWPMVCTCVALTNRPFLTELPAVAASETAARAGSLLAHDSGDSPREDAAMDRLLSLLAVALGLDTPALANSLGCKPDAKGEEVLTHVAVWFKAVAKTRDEATARVVLFANALGVPPDASAEAVAAKAEALKAPLLSLAVVANSLGVAPDSKPEDMAKVVAALRGQAADTSAERLVANAVEAGKIPPALADWWTKQAKGDFKGTEQTINSLPVILSLKSGASGTPPGAAAGLTAEEKTFANALGVAESDVAADKAAFLNSVDLRDEFRSLQTYLAFRGAERTGRARLYTRKG